MLRLLAFFSKQSERNPEDMIAPFSMNVLMWALGYNQHSMEAYVRQTLIHQPQWTEEDLEADVALLSYELEQKSAVIRDCIARKELEITYNRSKNDG